MRIIIIGLYLFSLLGCAASEAAQYAPNYQVYSYSCNGQQYDNGFALDYSQDVYIRHIEMLVVGAMPGQYGTVTLSLSVPPGQPAPFIAGFSGSETSAHIDYGVNGVKVPLGQALAPEYSCVGGGNRTLLLSISYTSQAGPNP